MPTPRAMFRILSVTCLLMHKALRFDYSRLAHVLHVERFCISTVYIIRMSFSASNNFIIVITVVVPRVCVCLFVGFCRYVHLDPDVRVLCGTENSFIYYNRDFVQKLRHS